ncbi:MAG: arsenate reductase (glutaredoxin) [Snodgrassella sp.]|nr:arsenate reductase (glutaredoxin) [Snodgrassella sp.]
MTSTVILYHNPNCSKSRAALLLLKVRNVDTKVIPYLTEPLGEEQIRNLKKKLAISSVREMMRSKDTLYSDLQLDQADEDTLIAAIAAHPILIERPIVVFGEHAAIGRPLTNIEALLENHVS